MDHPVLRMTQAAKMVLRFMLKHPDRAVYGAEISTGTGLASGTIAPILGRLERLGYVTACDEDIDPAKAGRPRRRYYSFTNAGPGRARRALLPKGRIR